MSDATVTTGPEFNKEAKQAHKRLMLAWGTKYKHVLDGQIAGTVVVAQARDERTPEHAAMMDEMHDITLIGQALDPIAAAERARKRAAA